jgi:FkbH-like protein
MELRKRGIVLAVSSKNSDEIARQPFEKHPEMLLKLEHIAVFQANWNDKAANIRAIAKELALGLDAMVFVDDNPVERGLVRELLPDVAVPELPEDPSLYVRTLAAGGYFESIALAVEDLNRADFYQDNAQRATLQQQSGDLSAYLASLGMTITFRPFDAMGRARIVQLINKSNQYNLTTIRYSEADVAAAENDPHTFTLQVRLKDKFGDNGMISVVICRRIEPAVWTIDTWLMSCRVLGRHVERMVLREIVRHARLAGVRVLHGVYKPTDRNRLVVDHYSRLGFTKIDESAAGDTFWELSVGSADPAPAPMTVVTEGFPDVSR